LEDGLVLQGPRGTNRRGLPSLERGEEVCHKLEIPAMVRAEVEPSALPCPAGDGREEIGLQDAVFVVALLGPGIRKEHPDLLKRDACRQGVEKLQGIGAHKVAVGEPAAPGLFQGADNPFAAQIDADTEPIGKLGRITLQKVTVAAPDFPDDGPGLGQDGGEFGAQGAATLGHELDKFRF
jgi:hypothetical protein